MTDKLQSTDITFNSIFFPSLKIKRVGELSFSDITHKAIPESAFENCIGYYALSPSESNTRCGLALQKICDRDKIPLATYNVVLRDPLRNPRSSSGYDKTGNAICGRLDVSGICNLSPEATGTITDTGITGVITGIWKNTAMTNVYSDRHRGFDTQDYKDGWAFCEYAWNFTNIADTNIDNNRTKMGQWLFAMISSIPPNFRQRMRDSNLVYGCLIDFYDQIYNTGYYAISSTETDFRSINILKDIDNFKDKIIDYYLDRRFYDPEQVPVMLKSSLKKLLVLPAPIYNRVSNKGFIKLSLSYYQYKQWLDRTTSTEKDSFLSLYLNNFFKDSEGTVKIGTTNLGINNEVKIFNSTLLDFTAIKINSSLYTIVNISQDNFNITQNPDMLFAYANIYAEIERWSPIVAVFFEKFGTPVSLEQCNDITRDTKLKTMSCFLKECKNDETTEQCLQYLKDHCDRSYSTSVKMFGINTGDSFLSNLSEQCKCYESTLPPYSEKSIFNTTALCFDRNCSQKIKDYHNVTDNRCFYECKNIAEWIKNRERYSTADLSRIDLLELQRICGLNYNIISPESINKKVISIGLLMIVTICFAITQICFYKKYESETVTIILIITIVLLCGLLYFLSLDLAGISTCEGNKTLCKSKITKIDIPEFFCKNKTSCDCETNFYCKAECECIEGKCIPKDPNANYDIIKKTKINTFYLTSLILGFIFLTIGLYYSNFSNTDFRIIVLILFGILLLMIYFFCRNYTEEKIYTDSCLISENQEENDESLVYPEN